MSLKHGKLTKTTLVSMPKITKLLLTSLVSEQPTKINMGQCCVMRHILMITMEKHFSQYLITCWINSGELHFLLYDKTEQLARDKPEITDCDIFLPTRILDIFFDIENDPSNEILQQLALLS